MLTLLAAVLCLMPRPAAAQPSTVVGVDQRVRITTSDRGKLTGRILAVTPDRMQLLPDSRRTPLTVEFVSVTRLDTSRGGKSRGAGARKGAIRGALLAGIAGAISLGLQHEQVGEHGTSMPRAAALGAFSGGLFGGTVGAAIGAARGGERWKQLWPSP
jgi:hypothetical protein